MEQIDFNDILTIVASVVLMVIGAGLRTWLQLNKGKLTEQDEMRLRFLSEQAVAAAEELGKREKWTGAQKLAFAKDTIKGAYPDVDEKTMEVIIHSAISFAISKPK